MTKHTRLTLMVKDDVLMRRSEARTVCAREQANAGGNNRGQNPTTTHRWWWWWQWGYMKSKSLAQNKTSLKQRTITTEIFNVQIDQLISYYHK